MHDAAGEDRFAIPAEWTDRSLVSSQLRHGRIRYMNHDQ